MFPELTAKDIEDVVSAFSCELREQAQQGLLRR
jgi:hypothetical protein